MVLDEHLKALITLGADVQALRQSAMAQGMCSLRMAATEKANAGLTTVAEVLRVTPGDPETNPLYCCGVKPFLSVATSLHSAH